MPIDDLLNNNRMLRACITTPAKISIFTEAKIISKDTVCNNADCNLTFEFRNGQHKRFAVPLNIASHLFENDTGVLEFKGDTFIGFTN